MPEIPISAAFDRPTLLSDQDLYLFNEGSNYRMYETMGAHLVTRDDRAGAMFSDRQFQFMGCAQQLAGTPQ
jgi:1,4-alpha-glucan branching enzyme